ncbi:GFA family protein [Sphingobium fontiphilum]|nr:GFA family protein [Sphingobium fontiphilum]
MVTGGCHCGAVRYEAAGDPVYSALCHCSDCRKSAGAPMVGWALFPKDKVMITGEVASYASSEQATRQFCARCGTGLFYRNESIFPGQIDIQTATFDDQAAFPPGIHVQYAEAAPWMEGAHELPKFERYPGL